MPVILDRLRKALENVDGTNYDVTPQVSSEVRHHAAVLILLLPHVRTDRLNSGWFSDHEIEDEEEYDVLLTRRSPNLRNFPGHVAFPGGKLDPGDLTIIHTALREANEEVGIRPEEVTVLGVLPPILSRYGHLTFGVVGFLNDKCEKWTCPINEMELDDVFRIPLRRFLSNRGLYVVRPVFFGVPTIMIGMADMIGRGNEVRVRETWGMTAVFAIVTATLAYEKLPEYPLLYTSYGIMMPGRTLKERFQAHNEYYVQFLVKSKL